MTTTLSAAVLGAEYEVDGNLAQVMYELNGTQLTAAASFTVFVRDCGWLIRTTETDEIGGVTDRETGSTNGAEIFECIYARAELGSESSKHPGTQVRKPMPARLCIVTSNNVPVGETDSAVVAHLWLMFASQCYWPTIKTNELTPVFDWHAAVAVGGQNRKVRAEWELLADVHSLPQEVRYLGRWGETNGLYSARGIVQAGRMLIPNGFTFEQYRMGPLNVKSFMHDMVLTKRISVNVTAVRPSCSRTNLIPSPTGSAWIIDQRFDSGISNRPPSYKNPVVGKWPAIEESKVLAKRQQASDLAILNRMKVVPEHQSKAGVMVVICSLLIAPLVVFGVFRVRKHASEEKLNGHG